MKYDLPNLKLVTPQDWPRQRIEWLALASDLMYGHAPDDKTVRGETLSVESIWDGQGIRESVRIYYGTKLDKSFDATLHRPINALRHPVITWNQFKPTDPCPIIQEIVTKCGYTIAAFDRTQLTHDETPGRLDAREAYPDHDWGAIRIWAWGHQKLADYLVTRDDVDVEKLAVTGHSRGGKAALAAAIFDERFAVCCPINAGAAGTGCFRYLGDKNGLNQDFHIVESMGRISAAFPHWWGPRFKEFQGIERPDAMGMESEMPFDLHTLKALIAPRALMTCEGMEDSWSNPFGTWVTWLAAQSAFDMLGGRNDVFYRSGGHEFGLADWRAVVDFCDEVFFGKNTGSLWNNPPFTVGE